MGSAERTGAGQAPRAVDGPLSGYRILDLTTVRRRRPAPSTPSRTCSPIPTSPAGTSSGASPTRARARPSRSARRPASPARPRRCAAPRPSSGSTPCRRSRKPGSNRPGSTACSAAGPPSSPDPGPPRRGPHLRVPQGDRENKAVTHRGIGGRAVERMHPRAPGTRRSTEVGPISWTPEHRPEKESGVGRTRPLRARVPAPVDGVGAGRSHTRGSGPRVPVLSISDPPPGASGQPCATTRILSSAGQGP